MNPFSFCIENILQCTVRMVGVDQCHLSHAGEQIASQNELLCAFCYMFRLSEQAILKRETPVFPWCYTIVLNVQLVI
jgi:hypothetical protein